MAFVAMVHERSDAERFQRLGAAYAEHDLLLQSFLSVGNVEFVGNVAQLVGVFLDVGIEQNQARSTDIDFPELDAQWKTHERHIDVDGITLSVS